MTGDDRDARMWVKTRQRVELRTAQGGSYAHGVVGMYCDAPSIAILTDGGETVHWRADLAWPVTGPGSAPPEPVADTDLRDRIAEVARDASGTTTGSQSYAPIYWDDVAAEIYGQVVAPVLAEREAEVEKSASWRINAAARLQAKAEQERDKLRIAAWRDARIVDNYRGELQRSHADQRVLAEAHNLLRAELEALKAKRVWRTAPISGVMHLVPRGDGRRESVCGLTASTTWRDAIDGNAGCLECMRWQPDTEATGQAGPFQYAGPGYVPAEWKPGAGLAEQAAPRYDVEIDIRDHVLTGSAIAENPEHQNIAFVMAHDVRAIVREWCKANGIPVDTEQPGERDAALHEALQEDAEADAFGPAEDPDEGDCTQCGAGVDEYCKPGCPASAEDVAREDAEHAGQAGECKPTAVPFTSDAENASGLAVAPTEPRVWREGDPEPRCYYLDPDACYIVRDAAGWLWIRHEQREGGMWHRMSSRFGSVGVGAWQYLTQDRGPLTEVVEDGAT